MGYAYMAIRFVVLFVLYSLPIAMVVFSLIR
ncbi:hypothetical protein BCCR75502_02442 [Burkholderia sola]|nr:hypothetical protein IST4129_00064 [Burkholderia cenocepacia]CAB5082635.1 hypothetical protein IST439_00096 [Burkholderia cenocepacia]CAB5087375.1 hypothetical protein IST4134_00064 [Burkholderia cenocepacia]CAB5087377.1 hypothetical protein IST4116A_00064 [Burkholderia cenocepacia]CAB5087619.1 hypothetical protein IST4110_00064 [Burkholderia cenocepacia]